jgi:hypothetical protein
MFVIAALFIIGGLELFGLLVASMCLGFVLLIRGILIRRRPLWAGAAFVIALVVLMWSGISVAWPLLAFGAFGFVMGVWWALRGAWPTRFKVTLVIGLVGAGLCLMLPGFLEKDIQDPVGLGEGEAAIAAVWMGVWTVFAGLLVTFTPRKLRNRLLSGARNY